MTATQLFASREGGSWRVMATDENGNYTVADMSGDNQQVNAELFATAPKMLELLSDIDANMRRAWNDGSLSTSAWPLPLMQRLSQIVGDYQRPKP